jgi:Alr-MurF fusion protein
MFSRELAQVTGGQFLNFSEDHAVETLVFDSRLATASLSSVFFAINGLNHDGHRFVSPLYQRGIRQFVIEKKEFVDLSVIPLANVLLVDDSVEALQKLAIWHRNIFPIPAIGITGSNGKTIVKEWLYQLLSPSYKVVKSPKSYNSQIGVPLSVWQIKPEHNLGIFEAGVSHMGEMERLANIIQPQIGIFTNLGPAHAEGFSSMEQKAEEKAKLFANTQTIIYRMDHVEVDKALTKRYPSEKLLSWSAGETATWKVLLKQTDSSKTLLFKHNATGVESSFQIPFGDDASVENLSHCILTMKLLAISDMLIQERIYALSNIPMRLELKAGRHNNYVIDDTYNNDPEGLRVALNFMRQQGIKKNKVVILSDMQQTGVAASILYPQIAATLQDFEISTVVGIGQEISSQRQYFPSNALFYESTEAFIAKIPHLKLADSLVLVKGARSFQFERIVNALVQKIHRTVLEVNLNALTHNLNVFRQLIKPETKMMVMVKAFAYGAGSYEVAHLLQFNKVDYLAVAYTDEGIELRENHISVPIMVMNPAVDEFDSLLKHQLEPEIYSFQILQALIEHVNHLATPQTCHVHLAIDTGMHRLGFEQPDIDPLCTILKQHPWLQVVSVFSHLVGADGTEHDTFSRTQAAVFQQVCAKLEAQLGYKFIQHLLNSAGITRLPEYQFDMVRLGIGLYGIETLGHPKSNKLQNVGTLKTVISQVRQVKAGDSIGYNRKGKAERDSQIATIAIGYADGFSRAFSNGVGNAWVKGKIVPVIGNVCMDMTMLDVTGANVKEGDEVILFGKELPVEVVAKAANTIAYEILTNVSERVKRVFYAD